MTEAANCSKPARTGLRPLLLGTLLCVAGCSLPAVAAALGLGMTALSWGKGWLELAGLALIAIAAAGFIARRVRRALPGAGCGAGCC